jgi:hypothetical protein
MTYPEQRNVAIVLDELDRRVGAFSHVQGRGARLQRKRADNGCEKQSREENDNARKEHLRASQQQDGMNEI